MISQELVDGRLNIRIEMNRVDHSYVRAGISERADRLADVAEARAEGLAPMSCDQDKFPPALCGVRLFQAIEVISRKIRIYSQAVQEHGVISFRGQSITHPEQGINYGITGHKNLPVRQAFLEEILSCGFGGSEVQRREAGGEDAIGFFRPWGLEVARAQAGFDVANGDAVVKRGQGRAKNRGGVPLNEDQIGLFGRKIAI